MLFNALANIVNHELKLYTRKGGEMVTALGFFLMALTLFPFAMGSHNPVLPQYAPALIWVVALLAALLSLPAMLQRDAADGALDQLRLSGAALEWVMLAKILANWIGCHLPLIFISPVLGLMLGMESGQGVRLMLSLLIGTPVLSSLGMLVSALTLHAGNKNGILAILILPLYMPALIFAASLAMSPLQHAIVALPETMLLGAISLLMLPASCWLSAWVIRLQD